jgi:precorrin-2 dehydrogenase/sirohydrochlorin ferrochelatase
VGYYAAYLDVTGKRCLVIGEGKAADDKVAGLEASGARVVRLGAEAYRDEELDGCFLVIDASLDDDLGVRVANAARFRRVLVNVLDRPALCDFIAPALVRRGPLQVAVSTAGRSPFMASLLRRRLEGEYGPEWGELVELVGRLRDRLRAQGMSVAEQTAIYESLPVEAVLQLLRAGEVDRAGAAIDSSAPVRAT